MGRPAGEFLNDIAAGREDAFARLYDDYGASLLRAATRISRRREDGEDAVQDVFVALVRAGPAALEIQDLKAYLFSAVHRAAVKRSEKRRSERPMESSELEKLDHATANAAQPAEPAPRLERALASLPDEQRAVIALKIDGDLTFEQIAAALNVSANTAASRYRYALEKLRVALEPTRSERSAP